MKCFRMCCIFAIQLLILISFKLSNLSEARNLRHINPSAIVVGTVYCDTCFQDDFSRSSHFISGATVSVECKDAGFKEEVKTDEQGKFKVHLPFSISKHEKEIKGCQVRLVNSSEPYCAVASTATSSSIHLKSRKKGTRIFSARFFTFKPLKQPDLCNQQPSITSSTKINPQKSPLDPITNTPLVPGLPTVPQLPPLPQLPPVQPLPGLPNTPNEPPKQTRTIPAKGLESSKESTTRPQFFFPPIFPSPPPAVTVPLPPNPLEPPPLLPFPPNPLQPPSPSFGLPSIPGLTPPPPPALPIPFPPVPRLPIPPIIPGVPPAKKGCP